MQNGRVGGRISIGLSFGERVVRLDGFVEIAGAYYAPPPGWIGRTVHVQWNEQHVRLIDPKTGALLREHLVADRGRHRMRPEGARAPRARARDRLRDRRDRRRDDWGKLLGDTAAVSALRDRLLHHAGRGAGARSTRPA